MFATTKPDRYWSHLGLRVLIGAIVASVAIALLEGIVRGPVQYSTAALTELDRGTFSMVVTWITDFRYLADQAVYAATIFFVGAKFFETRSVLTIGFDRLDASKIVLKEPGDDNIVWIGHRYGTAVEADAIARVFAERLKESAG